jgi:hypothetical protein
VVSPGTTSVIVLSFFSQNVLKYLSSITAAIVIGYFLL